MQFRLQVGSELRAPDALLAEVRLQGWIADVLGGIAITFFGVAAGVNQPLDGQANFVTIKRLRIFRQVFFRRHRAHLRWSSKLSPPCDDAQGRRVCAGSHQM